MFSNPIVFSLSVVDDHIPSHSSTKTGIGKGEENQKSETSDIFIQTNVRLNMLTQLLCIYNQLTARPETDI